MVHFRTRLSGIYICKDGENYMSIYDYDKDEMYIDVPYEFWDKLDKWFEWLEKEEQYLSTYKHNRDNMKCRKIILQVYCE